jgi:hypothetical protein
MAQLITSPRRRPPDTPNIKISFFREVFIVDTFISPQLAVSCPDTADQVSRAR